MQLSAQASASVAFMNASKECGQMFLTVLLDGFSTKQVSEDPTVDSIESRFHCSFKI